jgi:hypothetical protein
MVTRPSNQQVQRREALSQAKEWLPCKRPLCNGKNKKHRKRKVNGSCRTILMNRMMKAWMHLIPHQNILIRWDRVLLGQSLEVETQSSKTIGHSTDKRKNATISIEFPSVPATILFPDFPSVPTSPWPAEIRSVNSESKIQDAQKQIEAVNKVPTTEAPRKATNVQLFGEKCRRESRLSGKLQQRRHESENGYKGVTRSLSTVKSRNAPPVSPKNVDITQKDSGGKHIIHEEPLRSEPTTEDAGDQPPPVSRLSMELSSPPEGSSSTEMLAWDMKPEDLPLKNFSSSCGEKWLRPRGATSINNTWRIPYRVKGWPCLHRGHVELYPNSKPSTSGVMRANPHSKSS